MGPAYPGAGRKWGPEGFLEEEMPQLSPKRHAEVNQADRKECAGRGHCMCKGLEKKKNECLLDGPTARKWFGWAAGGGPGP